MDRAQTILAQRYPPPIDDGRGLLPDQIGFAAPPGMRSDIRRAATAAGTTAASFIRSALIEKLQACAMPPAKEA